MPTGSAQESLSIHPARKDLDLRKVKKKKGWKDSWKMVIKIQDKSVPSLGLPDIPD